MTTSSETVRVAANEVAAELRRRGISSDELVTVTIEVGEDVFPGRRESRVRVIAAGLGDGDINALIKQAQKDVEPTLR